MQDDIHGVAECCCVASVQDGAERLCQLVSGHIGVGVVVDVEPTEHGLVEHFLGTFRLEESVQLLGVVEQLHGGHEDVAAGVQFTACLLKLAAKFDHLCSDGVQPLLDLFLGPLRVADEVEKTVIGSKEYLTAESLAFEGTYAKLTIEVHTSLELVGLTAVLAKALADNGISANVVAAYYHDHVFVQYDLRQKATDILLELKQ